MSYITKDQLNLYLQKVGGQPSGPGASGAGTTGTTRSRSTLTGPRPPTFKASSRRIFQDVSPSPKLPSPVTPTSTKLENAVRDLSMFDASPAPSHAPNHARPPTPILESMGEVPVVMESMGSDDCSPPVVLQQEIQHAAAFGTVNGHPASFNGGSFQNWPSQGYHPGGYTQGPPSQVYSGHIGQDQYLHLQQQQQQQYEQYNQYQQQEYLRQQHAAQAVALGYLPTPTTASVHLQHPAPVSPTPNPPPMTITPRVIPVMEIPKYSIIKPSKAEIETLDDEDDNWAPVPPPRDPPKPPSRSHTPIEPVGPPVPPKIDIPTKLGAEHFDSPSSGRLSQTSTPKTPSQGIAPSDSERVPMPPPREFKRKSITPPTSASAITQRPTSASVFSVGASPVKSSASLNSASSAHTISSSRTTPVPGTVRANSAKFNALAAAGTGGSGAVTIGSKVHNSTTSPASANVNATTSSWTNRKAVDHLRKNSLSKGTGATALSAILPKTKRLTDVQSSHDSETPHSSMPGEIAPLESIMDKELPPILGDSPLYDAEHDSKCIITDEDRAEMEAGLVSLESKNISLEDTSESEDAHYEAMEDLTTVVPEEQASGPGTPPPSEESARPTSGQGSGHIVLPTYVCSSCDKAIVGTMITAMGKRWHSDHFVCTVCDVNLENTQFFHKDGQPYCSQDYHDKFSPKCGHCNAPIENECLTALGKSWHPDHFFCRECGDPFEEDGYMVHEDFPYCEKDYLRLFAPKCTGCLDPIQGDFINALKGKWHRDCFGCSVCHIGFDSTSYYVENGKPYCHTHYKKGSQMAT
ncbi:hypothetical protein EMPS_00688 [Entomortierella parvispora]|uniref:LIM zinc-binding domain-containing protein n=1 Tax=Entomortierella parvispora TaxID=205924 RepID=A0A9P3H264_9FUNG|nr:hypothetical protein EMPS_00688 [Entomortierella parvispora]